MSNHPYYQTRSIKKINQTINELSSHLPFTRKMTSQSALSIENSQSSAINQPHTVEQSASMHPARKTLTPQDSKNTLRPSSSFSNTEDTIRSSISSMNSQGFDLPTSTSPTPPYLQSSSNVNNEEGLDESSYTSSHVPPSTTTIDQTYFLKLEIDRLTKELEFIKLQQYQQQINTVRSSHPHATYAFLHQPTTTVTQLPNSTSTTPIHIIINTDPLQQMKDFVKPFNGNSTDDVTKWIESIVHYFDVAQVPGDKETLYFQYAPAFLKEYAYKWWTDQKHYIFNWSIFQQALITQFAEKNEYLIEQQLDQRKQQLNESVIKYYYDIIDLCKKYDPHMSDKQKIRKLTSGLKLSLYQEAIKENYLNPFEFLIKVQQLENIQKLIELRQNQTTQISSITKNDDKLSLSSQAHSSSNRQSNNYSTKPTYYSSSMQDDYSYKTQQSFPPPSQSYSSYGYSESNQNQQYPISQQMYDQPHSSTYHPNYSSGYSEIYCYNCGQPGHISRSCQHQTASPSAGQQRQQQKHSKNQ